jgi:hypothetical protein
LDESVNISGTEPGGDAGTDPQPTPEQNSKEVAETTAHLHIEGKGLDPVLESRYDDD